MHGSRVRERLSRRFPRFKEEGWLMMSVSRKIKSRSLAGVLAGCVGLIAAQASAGVVVGKPTPHGNTAFPEAGTTMARAGTLTLVGALQEHVKISGEAEPTFPST